MERQSETPLTFSLFSETEDDVSDGSRYPLADNRFQVSENNSVFQSAVFSFGPLTSGIGQRVSATGPKGIGYRQFRFCVSLA